MAVQRITSPDSPALDQLCSELRDRADQLDLSNAWPAEQLALCGDYGVFEWFIPREFGGQGWNQENIVRGYLALSEACLTTAFVMTQRTGACNRITSGEQQAAKQQLLPLLARGELFATVGISHLTTSRRHLANPVLQARLIEGGGYLLSGFSPWVTGAAHADYVVVGAVVMEDDQPTDKQLLALVPADTPGAAAAEPAKLVGLTASRTGAFRLSDIKVNEDQILAGPVENVMSHGSGGTTGGLQTSTLALGLTRAAANLLDREAERRADLKPPRDAIRQEAADVEQQLIAAVSGNPICSNEELRTRANSLALRGSQAAMAAAKGAGYTAGHPAGRLCREALFFLVWSCPQPVVAANLCELAGIQD